MRLWRPGCFFNRKEKFVRNEGLSEETARIIDNRKRRENEDLLEQVFEITVYTFFSFFIRNWFIRN